MAIFEQACPDLNLSSDEVLKANVVNLVSCFFNHVDHVDSSSSPTSSSPTTASAPQSTNAVDMCLTSRVPEVRSPTHAHKALRMHTHAFQVFQRYLALRQALPQDQLATYLPNEGLKEPDTTMLAQALAELVRGGGP